MAKQIRLSIGSVALAVFVALLVNCGELGGIFELPSYTIDYNANGGTGAVESSTHIYGTEKSLNANTFTRAGFLFSGWSVSADGSVEYADKQKIKNLTKTTGATVTLYAVWITGAPSGPVEMVFVAGGSFQMGKDLGGQGSEVSPVHTVTVSDFYMSKYEVTQAQYQTVTASTNNPGNFKGDKDTLPVECVSWYDAVEFCNKLSIQEGRTPVYTINDRTPASGYPITAATVTADHSKNGYRLPTEAEWEYAAKGGAGSPGNYSYAGNNTVDNVAWYIGNAESKTHAVGTKPANGLGLYDMSGNVWEWCWDRYGAYSSEAQTNPTGASSGDLRVYRGGSWDALAANVCSVYRTSLSPNSYSNLIGFRLVRSL